MPNYIFMNFQNHIMPILYFQHRLYFKVLYPDELINACVIIVFIKILTKISIVILNHEFAFIMNIDISQLILTH